ncbi:MAG: hypothetical protein HY371_03670 [Devosia nanyangense]|jgi:hypothetical protein|nr:hypothetical protein [Devosia nanyangense]
MAVTRSDLRHVLSKEDADLVEQARHPGLSELTSEELRQLSTRLRERRDRSTRLINNHRRSTKGRSQAGSVEKYEANQRRYAAIYAEAISRTNKERSRRTARARREELVTNSRRALARKQDGAKTANRPESGTTASAGMKAKASTRTRKVGAPSEKGRVSQATKVVQAKKDAKA